MSEKKVLTKDDVSEEELKAVVEGGDGIYTIRGGGNLRGWNGIRYKAGMSGKNVGSSKLSMNVATIPPTSARCRRANFRSW